MRPSRRSSPQGAIHWLLLTLALVGTGCPQDLDVVVGRGEPCERDEDCQTADLPCGAVLACLAGHCEVAGETPGIIEVCADADPMPQRDAGDGDGTDGTELDSGTEPGGDDAGT